MIKYMSALFVAAACILFSASDAKAEYVYDEVNGVSYDNEEEISVGYAYRYANGGDDYTSVSTDSDDRVVNVKSSSKNLLAKKTRERRITRTDVDYDYKTAQNITTTTTSYEDAYISYFAKKAGKYTVTFDVADKDGKVKCTKSITVIARGSSNYTYVSPVKSIKYAGKDLWMHSPYATRTKGKIQVKMNKGYKLVSLEVGKINSKGETVYKKVKNGKNITLAKSIRYITTDSDSYYSAKTTVDRLFPYTYLKVTYKNKKTKEVDYTTHVINTFNPKSK